MFDDHAVVHNPFWKSLQGRFDINDPRSNESGVQRYDTDLDDATDINAFIKALLRFESIILDASNPTLSMVIKHPSVLPIRVDVIHESMLSSRRTKIVFQPLEPSPLNTSLNHLISRRMLSQEMADFLTRITKSGADIYVAGATGSGKTTFLRSVLMEAYQNSGKNVIAIEEFIELANIEYRAALPNALVMIESPSHTLRSLLAVSMRMRPDRIVVGELRDSVQSHYAGVLGNCPIAATYHTSRSNDTIDLDYLEGTLGGEIPENGVVVTLSTNSVGVRYVSGIYQIAPNENGDGQFARPLFSCTDSDLLTFEKVGLATRTFRRQFDLEAVSEPDPMIQAVSDTLSMAQENMGRMIQVTPEEAQEMLTALEILQKFFRRLI